MKKGVFEIGHELVMWFWRIFIVTIILLVIIAGVTVNLSRKVEIGSFENYLIINYLLYSDCLTNKVPGVIDLSKFGNDCIFYDRAGINLTLVYENKYKTKIFNEEFYKNNAPFCKLKTKDFICYSEKKYVLVRDGNVIKRGLLIINNIIKNE